MPSQRFSFCWWLLMTLSRKESTFSELLLCSRHWFFYSTCIWLSQLCNGKKKRSLKSWSQSGLAMTLKPTSTSVEINCEAQSTRLSALVSFSVSAFKCTLSSSCANTVRISTKICERIKRPIYSHQVAAKPREKIRCSTKMLLQITRIWKWCFQSQNCSLKSISTTETVLMKGTIILISNF